LWVILLAIGLMAYVTDTQLAPMDYPPQLRRGASALMFKKHLYSEPLTHRFRAQSNHSLAPAP
jgi:hypothetical protein